MRGRGLSRVSPQKRRRRWWWRGALLASAIVVAVAAGWWGRRPAIEGALRHWLPGVLGGQTELHLKAVGHRGARVVDIRHERPGWSAEVAEASLHYRWAGLKSGRVDTVDIAKLRVTRHAGGPETGFGLPVLDWPVAQLRLVDGELQWPELPPVSIAALVLQREGEFQMGTMEGLLGDGPFAAALRWKPEQGWLEAHLEGSHDDPLVLVAGHDFELPAGLGLGPVSWDASVLWGTEGPEQWAASASFAEVVFQDGSPGPAWRVAPLTLAVRGEEMEVRSAVLGGRVASRRIGEVEVDVGPFLVEGSLQGPLRFEAAEGRLSSGGDPAGELAWAVRGWVTAPAPGAAPPAPGDTDWKAARVTAEAVVPRAWRWGPVTGERFAGQVDAGAAGGRLRVPELRLSAPLALVGSDLDVEWESEGWGLPTVVNGSVAVNTAGSAAHGLTWEGPPVQLSATGDLEAGVVNAVGRLEPGSLVWVSGDSAFTGEVGGSLWLHGPLADPGAWGAEGSLTWSRGDLLLAGWQASGISAEWGGRLARWSPLEFGLGDWLETPALAAGNLLAWLNATGLAGQGVAAVGRVDGPADLPLQVSGLSFSLGREDQGEPTVEAVAESVRFGLWQGAEVRARLGWVDGRPTLASWGRMVPDGLSLRAAVTASEAGGWDWVGELEPLERGVWSPFPGALKALEPLSWRGALSASATGQLQGKGSLTASGVVKAAVDLLWGEEDPIRIGGLKATLAAVWDEALRTLGTQEVTVESVRSGDLEVTDLAARWSAPGDGSLVLESLTGKWLEGSFALESMVWTPEGGAAGTLHLNRVSLAALSSLWPDLPVRAAGWVDGQVAVTWRDGTVAVGEGTLRLKREGAPRLEVRKPGWLTARAAPRSREFQALETVERAAEAMALDELELRIHDPERPEATVWLRVSGHTLIPDVEAPITLEVNLNVALNQLINSKLWRQVDWK